MYHPRCAAIWFKFASTHKEILCQGVLHPEWLRSFKFPKPTTELKKRLLTWIMKLLGRCPLPKEKILSNQFALPLVMYLVQSIFYFHLYSFFAPICFLLTYGNVLFRLIVGVPCKQNAKLNVLYSHVQGSCHGTKIEHFQYPIYLRVDVCAFGICLVQGQVQIYYYYNEG